MNDQAHTIDIEEDASLLAVLRDELRLTGARFGCGHGQCGACVVLIDGKPVPSCVTSAKGVADRSIVTIEGLADGERLHPVQQAFLDEGALQCGYCASGMILSALALLERSSAPSETEIRDALAPHLCRCGIYLRAIRAVQRASTRMPPSSP